MSSPQYRPVIAWKPQVPECRAHLPGYLYCSAELRYKSRAVAPLCRRHDVNRSNQTMAGTCTAQRTPPQNSQRIGSGRPNAAATGPKPCLTLNQSRPTSRAGVAVCCMASCPLGQRHNEAQVDGNDEDLERQL